MAKSKIQLKIEELTAAHTESSKEDVIKLLAESLLANEKAKADLAVAEKDVEELNTKLSDFESGKIKKLPKPTVSVNKIVYVINSPQAKIKGTLFTAQQLRENTETVIHDGKTIKIADFLVKKKSGILSPKTQ